MKKLVFLVIGLVLAAGGAGAQAAKASLTERAQKLSAHLKGVEGQLIYADYEEVRDSLDRLELVLSRYQKPEVRSSLVCISDGNADLFERFLPTDLNSGAAFGGATTRKNCETLVAQATENFMCVSDGNADLFERFIVYDIKKARKVGGGTSLKSCLAAIPR
ncbi:hypothetical protein ACNQKP_15135 [Bdellovibrio bacteriovorus]|uniref:hypothetical protein n=1 Tax=Bdellovibrio bacteriovorus TaxID=959 RepID=UPI003AA87FFD